MNNSSDLTKKIPKQSSKKLRVIFAGTPDFAASSLNHIIEKQEELNIEVVAVYSQPDRKSGRGQKVTASAVKKVAVEHGIATEQPPTFKKSVESGVQARVTLKSYQADVMVVVAYGLILPVEVLDTPKFGCLNVHGSLLPRWRGAAPIHRAVLAGDDTTGITIMQMDKGLDTGDMLYKVACPISQTDTTASLHDKLAIIGAESIVNVLADLAHYQAQAEKQDETLVTYAEKLSKEEGAIDWTMPAENIARQIRGMCPYPSTFSFISGKRVKVIEALCVADEQLTEFDNSLTNITAGTVISINKTAIVIACGKLKNDSHSNQQTCNQTTCIQVTKLQFEGGKPLTAEQVCQSNKLVIGDIFDAL